MIKEIIVRCHEDSSLWHIKMERHDNGSVSYWVECCGITQDIIPADVAEQAAEIWDIWMQENRVIWNSTTRTGSKHNGRTCIECEVEYSNGKKRTAQFDSHAVLDAAKL